MNDKAYRTQKKRVKALVERWHAPLGMGWWKITFDWARSEFVDAPRRAMRVRTQYEYRCADIEVALPVVAELKDDALEHYLLHEYAHILIEGMVAYQHLEAEAFRLQDEYTATTLATIFQWVRDAGRQDLKRDLRTKKEAA